MDTDVNGLEIIARAEAIALLETEEVGRLVYTRRARHPGARTSRAHRGMTGGFASEDDSP
jgi:hypothetical protein